MPGAVNIFWFRRDLRLEDNAGLNEALGSGLPVVPVFLFDRNILDTLEPDDARVDFIHRRLEYLQAQLQQKGSGLFIGLGRPLDFFEELSGKFGIRNVFTNHDYEPYARSRDEEVKRFLEKKGIGFKSFKDQVIFEKSELVKSNGEPYTVFTPYARKWKERLAEQAAYSPKAVEAGFSVLQSRLPALAELGFQKSRLTPDPVPLVPEQVIRDYEQTRDLPALRGTSRLGIHLRFGTLSIRELVKLSRELNEKFLDELIWREFYQMILWFFPRVVQQSFRPAFDRMIWRNDEGEFARWCEGRTGYPIVDAGMRELAATGFMHNRVRMITASFLVKHLLIDWRWGEAWFASRLLDYELASNNGNWQWVAGGGCDAAPYYRIFNPEIQQKKFDPRGEYTRQWVPEYGTAAYPSPVVDHRLARERFLAAARRIR